MQTGLVVIALVALLGNQAWSQTIETLPPVAGPPAVRPRAVPYPSPPWSPPPEPYQRQLPPPIPFQPGPNRDRSISMPPAPSGRELQARDEPVRLRWRTEVEGEFADWWRRYGCFPHPRRHEGWFDMLADRLGATTQQQQHSLYGLVMERVELYDPPRTQFSGLLGDTEDWVNGMVGWRAAGDRFCVRG
jgi:hypothetical protein